MRPLMGLASDPLGGTDAPCASTAEPVPSTPSSNPFKLFDGGPFFSQVLLKECLRLGPTFPWPCLCKWPKVGAKKKVASRRPS